MKNCILKDGLFHRYKYMIATTRDLTRQYCWVPQWWFLWWHNHYEEIGYQFTIPLAYTESEFEYWVKKDECLHKRYKKLMRNVNEPLT